MVLPKTMTTEEAILFSLEEFNHKIMHFRLRMKPEVFSIVPAQKSMKSAGAPIKQLN